MQFFTINLFSQAKYWLPSAIIFSIFMGSGLSVSAAEPQPRTAEFAEIGYDVVYVRCPRGKEPVLRPTSSGIPQQLLNWNGVNDLWLSANNNVYHQPGCDLVLHDSSMTAGDPAAEKVLVDCDEDESQNENENGTSNPVCSVVDPNVSFDGRYVVYTKFTDTRTFARNLGTQGLQTIGRQSFMKLYPNGKPIKNEAGDVIGYGDEFAVMDHVNFKPYDAPALIFIYDLHTNEEVQVSPDSKLFGGRAHPGKDNPAEWTSKVPVMDTGPFFMPDGRIGFTSNREQGFGMFQLFAMDRDGRNMEVLGHRAMSNQLHPATLMDGRIVYTNFDRILQRTTNNNFSLFEINPDGSAPFIFAGKNDATAWSYHYFTQLSDGDIVVAVYYNHQQTGLGALERFPVDPPGPDFAHYTKSQFRNELGELLPTLPESWQSGSKLMPFARPGQFRLTPGSSPSDTPVPPYDEASDYFTHPADGRTVTMNGRFTHPSAAPENDLLTTYTIGGSSTIGSPIYRKPNTLEDVMAVIGKDAGIWLVPLEANSSSQVGHIAEDARIVVDFPQYHEIMPRAVVRYQDIYDMPRPDHNDLRAPTRNDGTGDSRLPAGAPYGLTGAASLYDRETRSLNGTPWNMKDGGGTMSGRNYMNLAVSGAELAIFDNDEIQGIRVLMPVPIIPKDGFLGEKWAGQQKHHLRILGEYPVRKLDESGEEPRDGQNNPDTSFIVRVPADTPFLMQTIDKRGMALDIETASRSVVRGEQQFCSGCHVHTRDGMNPQQALSGLNKFGDFTGDSAPLFVGEESGFPTVASAQATYPLEDGVNARRSFAVDWDNNIAAIVEKRCASCHEEGADAQELTGLRLEGDNKTYELLTKNRYANKDGISIGAGSKPGNGLDTTLDGELVTEIGSTKTDRITPHYQCCTPSRWLSLNSARSSMLVWALYGERLDGRDPHTGLPPEGSGVVVDGRNLEHPEIWPKVAEHLAYLDGSRDDPQLAGFLPGATNMPEAEKRLIARWLDIGAPKLNVHDDMMRPVMTLTPVDGGGGSVSSILVGLWDDSPLDFERFKVTANGTVITPPVTATSATDTVTVSLLTQVTEANADSIEITLEIWDKPDRSWSRLKPGEAAANRVRRTVTGRGLLRMVGSRVANQAPTFAEATITTYEDTPSTGVFAEVNDPNSGDSHTVSNVSEPSKGTAEVKDNKLFYTPNIGAKGIDSFTFDVTDSGELSVQGIANVTILAGPPPPANSKPTFASASITTQENTKSVAVTPQVTDPDPGDAHTFTLIGASNLSKGTAGVTDDNKLIYTPAPGFVGNDSFEFEATDSGGLSVIGTASVEVVGNAGGNTNSAPTAASASITTHENTESEAVAPDVIDDDVGDTHEISLPSSNTVNGSVQVIDNELVYTPNDGFSGRDSFQFVATDSGNLSVEGTASVTVIGGFGYGGNIDGWIPHTASSWGVGEGNDSGAYHLKTAFNSLSGNRLGEYSLLPGSYEDFTFTAQARFGADPAGALADYAVVFGYEDENNYYYALFNNAQNATQLFKVVDGKRGTALATAGEDKLQGSAYHNIKVIREGSTIQVYVDGVEIMTVTGSAPSAGQVGVGSFNDTAYFKGVSVSESTVPDLALKIDDISLANAQVGESFSFQMTASDGSGSYDWNITTEAGAGVLPAGLNLTVEGVLSGIPTQDGTYSFTLRVQDEASASDTLALSMTVDPAALKINTDSLSSGQVQKSFTFTMNATGGRKPYAWSINTLPEGLHLDRLTGVLSGTPTTAGTYDLTLTVKDNDSAEVTETLEMSVAAADSGGDGDGGGGGSQGPLGLLMLSALLFVSRRLWRADMALLTRP